MNAKKQPLRLSDAWPKEMPGNHSAMVYKLDIIIQPQTGAVDVKLAGFVVRLDPGPLLDAFKSFCFKIANNVPGKGNQDPAPAEPTEKVFEKVFFSPIDTGWAGPGHGLPPRKAAGHA